jgi:broad-specificity NMP kinase
MEQKRLLIGITGTPGTGKSHFAKRLKKLRGLAIIELNQLAKRKRLILGSDRGADVVDLKRLAVEVKRAAKRNGTTVVVGHLVPEIGLRYDIIIVMRTALPLLRRRLSGRHYGKVKLSDNLVCEALDYCGLLSKTRTKELYELETEQEKRSVIRYITQISSGAKARRPKARVINKMGELLSMLERGRISQVSPSRF